MVRKKKYKESGKKMNKKGIRRIKYQVYLRERLGWKKKG
jgi:hypothetical protein